MAGPSIAPAQPAAPRPPPRTPQVVPLDAGRARLHLTVSRRFLAKLETARAELSHARPGASAEDVLEVCLDLLLAQRAKRKALVAKPRSPRATPATRAAAAEVTEVAAPVAPSNDVSPVSPILPVAPSNDVARAPTATPPRRAFPAAVRREAWARAGGRCEWPLEAGGMCGSTLRLELDHHVPVALGGAPTIDNVRVVCRFHNLLAARRALGDALMAKFTHGE